MWIVFFDLDFEPDFDLTFEFDLHSFFFLLFFYQYEQVVVENHEVYIYYIMHDQEFFLGLYDWYGCPL